MSLVAWRRFSRDVGASGAHRSVRVRRGTSLVEILVVLVILTIGIFAIVRLFPEGMLSLNYSGNVTLAHAMVRENEELLRSRQDNLPEGVVGVDPAPAPNQPLIRENLTPDAIRSTRPYTDNPINGAAGTPPDDPRSSGVNQVRRIIGERFQMPPPSLVFGNGTENVSLYRPLYTPLYSLSGHPGSSLGVTAYSGTPFRRIVISQEPTTPEDWQAFYQSLDPYSYAVDYDNAKLYFRNVGYDRIFRIDGKYRALVANNRYVAGQMSPTNSIYLPAGADNPANPQGSIQAFDLRQNRNTPLSNYERLPMPGDPVTDDLGNATNVTEPGMLDPESEFLYRQFRLIQDPRLPFSTAPQSDPYEFKVYDPVFGLMGFNPRVGEIAKNQPGGGAQVVRLDYDVDDWHILRQDAAVPTELLDQTRQGTQGSFHSLKLSTGAIKKVGDMEETVNFPVTSTGNGPVETTFEHQGLVRYYPAARKPIGQQVVPVPARPGTPGIDMVLVDVETGLQIDSRTLQRPGTNLDPNVNNTNGEIDYAHGVIHLREVVFLTLPFALQGQGQPPTVQVRSAGRRFRIYYRNTNDFAVALMKPFRNYTDYGSPPPGTQTRLPSFQDFQPYRYGVVLFNNTDAGKTVAVDYQWRHAGTGEIRTVIGELHQIQAPGTPFEPGPRPNQCDQPPPGKWWVRVRHADRQACVAGDQNFDPDVVPGSVRILGVRGASYHTWVEWREHNRWRWLQRSTILGQG